MIFIWKSYVEDGDRVITLPAMERAIGSAETRTFSNSCGCGSAIPSLERELGVNEFQRRQFGNEMIRETEKRDSSNFKWDKWLHEGIGGL